MLVQMLTDRVAQGGSYNLTFGESLVMSGIGILVMAITADKLGTQPSELSFRAIRAIELPEDLGGLKPEEAAELVSKCAADNGFTLDTVTIKSIKAC